MFSDQKVWEKPRIAYFALSMASTVSFVVTKALAIKRKFVRAASYPS